MGKDLFKKMIKFVKRKSGDQKRHVIITGSKPCIKGMDLQFPVWQVESLSPPSSQKRKAEQTENQQRSLDPQRIEVTGQMAA